jgi:hypothetical protein
MYPTEAMPPTEMEVTPAVPVVAPTVEPVPPAVAPAVEPTPVVDQALIDLAQGLYKETKSLLDQIQVALGETEEIVYDAKKKGKTEIQTALQSSIENLQQAQGTITQGQKGVETAYNKLEQGMTQGVQEELEQAQQLIEQGEKSATKAGEAIAQAHEALEAVVEEKEIPAEKEAVVEAEKTTEDKPEKEKEAIAPVEAEVVPVATTAE